MSDQIVAGIIVPGADSPYLPGAGSISSRISNRLGLFTCPSKVQLLRAASRSLTQDYYLKLKPLKQATHGRGQIKFKPESSIASTVDR